MEVVGVTSLLLGNESAVGENTAVLTCSPGWDVASEDDEEIESLLKTFADDTDSLSDSNEFFRSAPAMNESPNIGSASNVGVSYCNLSAGLILPVSW